jgi:hypothetical protein
MKKSIVLFFTLFLLMSCSKDEETIVSKPEVVDPSATAVLKYMGTLIAKPGESGSGTANIYLEGSVNTLKFENFSITNGPDLKVYLSKTEGTESIVNLGSLKTSGIQVYTIPSGVVISDYKYVLIYCQQYKVLFSSALLNAK